MIEAQHLTAARTCTMRGDPDTVVLALTYGTGEALHLYLSRAEFVQLARQMATDALTLSASAAGSA